MSAVDDALEDRARRTLRSLILPCCSNCYAPADKKYRTGGSLDDPTDPPPFRQGGHRCCARHGSPSEGGSCCSFGQKDASFHPTDRRPSARPDVDDGLCDAEPRVHG